jgi:hypothetical protein
MERRFLCHSPVKVNVWRHLFFWICTRCRPLLHQAMVSLSLLKEMRDLWPNLWRCNRSGQKRNDSERHLQTPPDHNLPVNQDWHAIPREERQTTACQVLGHRLERVRFLYCFFWKVSSIPKDTINNRNLHFLSLESVSISIPPSKDKEKRWNHDWRQLQRPGLFRRFISISIPKWNRKMKGLTLSGRGGQDSASHGSLSINWKLRSWSRHYYKRFPLPSPHKSELWGDRKWNRDAGTWPTKKRKETTARSYQRLQTISSSRRNLSL